MTKCISCEYLVLDIKKGNMGLCWREKSADRVLIDVSKDRKCDMYRLGPMDQVRVRAGFKP